MDQLSRSACALITSVLFAAPAALAGNPKQPAEPFRCGDPLAFQVLLDREGFSPGEIDGKPGPNLARAIRAFQEARNLPLTAEPDCPTWEALADVAPPPTIARYTITDADAAGPFTKRIPRSLPQQASLPALGYMSASEKLAEKFHTSPEMLERLNAGVSLTAGTQIDVPNVVPFEWDAPNPSPAAAPDVAITVSRAESALRVTTADGTLMFFAPVTTGSEHDPLPQGSWTVTSVHWKPTFNYNPDLFWDAKPTDTKSQIKPGPNNPVGIVWIALTKPHYGIHGTPEPGRVGHSESHGCVRLTNWDAARLAALVTKGTPVLFR